MHKKIITSIVLVALVAAMGTAISASANNTDPYSATDTSSCADPNSPNRTYFTPEQQKKVDAGHKAFEEYVEKILTGEIEPRANNEIHFDYWQPDN